MINRNRSAVAFDVDIHFSGRTSNQAGKDHNCLNANKNNWYYYTTTTCTLTGRDTMAGAKISVSRFDMPFQVGKGANVTHNSLALGASGWLSLNITSQPNNGIQIHINTGSTGQNGDINMNLSGSETACTGGSSRIANTTLDNAIEAEKEVALTETSTESFGKVFNTNTNLTQEKEVSVYPNPVREELFIRMASFKGKQAQVLLTNQYGQVVTQLQLDRIDNAPVRLDVNRIPNGLYILTIRATDNSKMVSKKSHSWQYALKTKVWNGKKF